MCQRLQQVRMKLNRNTEFENDLNEVFCVDYNICFGDYEEKEKRGTGY